jgi:hypothetical protein
LYFEFFNRPLHFTDRRRRLLLSRYVARRDHQAGEYCWEDSPHTIELTLWAAVVALLESHSKFANTIV